MCPPRPGRLYLRKRMGSTTLQLHHGPKGGDGHGAPLCRWLSVGALQHFGGCEGACRWDTWARPNVGEVHVHTSADAGELLRPLGMSYYLLKHFHYSSVSVQYTHGLETGTALGQRAQALLYAKHASCRATENNMGSGQHGHVTAGATSSRGNVHKSQKSPGPFIDYIYVLGTVSIYTVPDLYPVAWGPPLGAYSTMVQYRAHD